MRYKDTKGDDILIGTSADDVFVIGLGGTDSVDGKRGFDRLEVDYSGFGPDQFIASGISILESGAMTGDLRTRGDGKIVSVHFDNIESLSFLGGSNDDELVVTIASEAKGPAITADLGEGNDTLSLYYDDSGAKSIELRADGTVQTGIGTFSGVERLSVVFGDSNDSAIGGSGDDVLLGEGGNDQLSGGAGGDLLFGGAGADLLTGGLGADRFQFNEPSESRRKTTDTILDFSHGEGDTIDLSRIDANKDFRKDQAFVFIDQQEFSGHSGELRQQINGDGTVTLQGDVNHDGVADFAIIVHTSVPLAVGDFVL